MHILAGLDSWDMEAVSRVSTLWRHLVFNHFWRKPLVRCVLLSVLTRHDASCRYVVSRNRSRGSCTESRMTLPHTGKVVGLGEQQMSYQEHEDSPRYPVFWNQ